MSRYTLKNEYLEVIVDDHGAEVKAINSAKTGMPYLWNSDPAFWNRSSPVLFPFVGAVKNKEYRYKGKTYTMGQHGFARDMDFQLTGQSEEKLTFLLTSDEETKKKYPFDFRLTIGYQLKGNELEVLWQVENPAKETLYFAIGAHPAFLCPIREGEKSSDYAFVLRDRKGQTMEHFVIRCFGEGGCVRDQEKVMASPGGRLPISEHLFDEDALVLENGQAGGVGILDAQGSEYLTVTFSSPLVGIWSPPGKHAPFVCIEPWYGRCDSESFEGQLDERDWQQRLAGGGRFEASYTICIRE